MIANDNNTSIYDPVYAAGVVYLCVRHFTNPTTGGVAALDAATGSVVWQQDLPAKPPNNSSSCNARVALVGSVLVVATQDGNIYGLDRQSGTIIWSAPQLTNLPPGSGSPMYDQRPLVASGTSVVVGSTTGYIVALDGASGRELWRSSADRGSAIYPLSSDAHEVFVTYVGLQLAAFDLATGAVNWIAEGQYEQGEYYASPAVDSDRLYVGGLHGLYALRK